MAPANRLRALIAAQLVWVALIGAATRFEGWAAQPRVAYWLFVVIVNVFYPVFFAFPILACLTAREANLPRWKFWLVVGIEAVLAFTMGVAMVPGPP